MVLPRRHRETDNKTAHAHRTPSQHTAYYIEDWLFILFLSFNRGAGAETEADTNSTQKQCNLELYKDQETLAQHEAEYEYPIALRAAFSSIRAN